MASHKSNLTFTRRFTQVAGALSNGTSLAKIGASSGAVPALFEGLNRVGKSIVESEFQERKKAVLEEAAQNGATEAEKAMLENREVQLRDNETLAAEAFNKSVQTAYLTRLDLNVDAAGQDIANRNADDPEAFGAEFDKSTQALVQTLPEEWQNAAKLEMLKRRNKWMSSISRKALEKEASQSNADIGTAMNSYSVTSAQLWRNGDIQGAMEQDKKFKGALDALSNLSAPQKAQGWIKYQTTRRRQATLGDFDRAMVQGLDYAEQYIKDFKADQNGIADPDERGRLANEMKSGLANLKTDRRVAVTELRNEASVAVDAVTSGRDFAGIDNLKQQAQALGDDETLTALDSAQSLSDGAQEFAKFTPQEMLDTINERRKSVKTDFDNKRLDVFENIFKKAIKGLDNQPLNWVEQNGVRALVPVDFTNPETMARRVQDGNWIRERYGLSETPLLKTNEADQLKAILAKAPAGEKTIILAALTAGFSEQNIPDVLQSVSASDPEFAHAGVIGLEDGEAAKTIIAGQEIRKLEPQYAPTNNVTYRTQYQFALPPKIFKGFSPDFTKGIEETVLSVYAKLSRDANDTTKTPDAIRLKEAVRIATGGIVKYDRDGIFSTDYQTIAPVRGMTSEQFTGFLDSLSDKEIGEPYLPAAGKRSGGRVTVSDILEYGTLITVGQGRYGVDIGGQIAVNRDGSPYFLDLKSILEHQARSARVSPPIAE